MEAGQGPAFFGGAAPTALCGQQLRDEMNGFPGDVEDGTIGDHVEPFTVARRSFDTSPSTWGSTSTSEERALRPSCRFRALHRFLGDPKTLGSPR